MKILFLSKQKTSIDDLMNSGKKLKCYLSFRPAKCTPFQESRTVQDVICVAKKKKNEISIDDYLLNNTLLPFLSFALMRTHVFVYAALSLSTTAETQYCWC